jgi:pimeloyl-ACP methyl ester carboxylesterase
MLALADALSPNAPLDGIGLSMGTGTLLHAAVARPDRFTRLVLTAPPTAWETRASQVSVYANQAALVESSSPEHMAVIFAQAPVAPIFRDVPSYVRTPSIAHALLPSVFRGAGLSDFPTAERLRGLLHPTLIIAWATDPGHPVSSAEKLHQIIPNSQLHVSNTSADIQTWGERIAAFLSE